MDSVFYFSVLIRTTSLDNKYNLNFSKAFQLKRNFDLISNMYALISKVNLQLY